MGSELEDFSLAEKIGYMLDDMLATIGVERYF